ncbi:hypothetical protein WR25_17100 [Diploscapter pachys]|uniref:Cation efflux protein transmembrane domain-containing protein n=1 Tax=Diploscapter pachys TaxID=2018661 RepID=A0A2A2JA25_9BILA|nr:hypothetical protein WR25_17100 [Diploscapter pachys]
MKWNGEERRPLLSHGKKSRKIKKALKRYYSEQAELLEAYRQDDEAIRCNGQDKESLVESTQSDQLLSKIVLLVNVFLLIGKGVATYLASGSSLSIISTLLDSVVDITSGLAIYLATRMILHTDPFKYPRGRKSIEKVTIMFIGVIMGLANLFVLVSSVMAIIQKKPAPQVTIASLSIILATVVIKAVLWIACYRKGTPSSNVLSIDQRNDVLTNTVAILGAVLSQIFVPQADPIAAALISGYIVYSWTSVILQEIPVLVGVSCSDQEYSRVARVIIEHSEKIRCIDTLLVYYTGHMVTVEAHVVLSEDTPCKQVHDEIVEPLQRKLECLSFVHKAYIHPDYECDGYIV